MIMMITERWWQWWWWLLCRLLSEGVLRKRNKRKANDSKKIRNERHEEVRKLRGKKRYSKSIPRDSKEVTEDGVSFVTYSPMPCVFDWKTSFSAVSEHQAERSSGCSCIHGGLWSQILNQRREKEMDTKREGRDEDTRRIPETMMDC